MCGGHKSVTSGTTINDLVAEEGVVAVAANLSYISTPQHKLKQGWAGCNYVFIVALH